MQNNTRTAHSPSANSTIATDGREYPKELRIVFGLIALLAFLSNGLLCVMIGKRSTILKKPYNTLVFALALTDSLTGWYNDTGQFIKQVSTCFL